MKEFLSQNGRAFTERNVDEDPSAYDELVARGWLTVPVTIIGGEGIRGYDVSRLHAALARFDRGDDPAGA